jgi:hypothetical protein
MQILENSSGFSANRGVGQFPGSPIRGGGRIAAPHTYSPSFTHVTILCRNSLFKGLGTIVRNGCYFSRIRGSTNN